jgi:hypothetical protein
MFSTLLSSLFSRRAQAQDTPSEDDFEFVEPPRLIARAFRRPFFRHGALVFGEGQRLNVAVKDLSAGGARVEFFVRTPLPEDVILCEPSLRLRCRAKVVWQSQGVAGLAFIEPQTARSAAA